MNSITHRQILMAVGRTELLTRYLIDGKTEQEGGITPCQWVKRYFIKRDRFSEIRKVASLLQNKNELGESASLLLRAGDAVFTSGEYAYASECFKTVLEILGRNPDQNIRGQALIGKMECLLEIARRRLKFDDLAFFDGHEETDLKNEISNILPSLDPNTRKNIEPRLSKAETHINILMVRSSRAKPERKPLPPLWLS